MQVIKIKIYDDVVLKTDLTKVNMLDALAVAIGNFDGVHLGHQEIIKTLKTIAKSKNLKSAVLLFDPHTSSPLDSKKQFRRIYNQENVIKFIAEFEVKYIFILSFNQETITLSPHQFLANILKNNLNVSHIIVGYNFHFGVQKSGNVHTIAHFAEKHNIGYSCVKKVQKKYFDVSSTKIKSLLKYGCVDLASSLLGRQYHIEGNVIKGLNIAKKILGINTANIRLIPKLYQYPINGVYLVNVILNENTSLPSIVNLGLAPSINQKSMPLITTNHDILNRKNRGLLLEAHIFDYCGDEIYGKKIIVQFKQFIRPERYFANIIDLRTQIQMI